jgi:hypothetical protein
MGSVAMEASIPCPLFPYYFPKLGISMDISQKQTINFLKEKSWETELIDASYHVLTSFVFYVPCRRLRSISLDSGCVLIPPCRAEHDGW